MDQLRCHANAGFVSFSLFMFLFIGSTAAPLNGDEPPEKTQSEQLEQRLSGMTNEEIRSLAKEGALPATISDLRVSPDQLNNALIKELAARLATQTMQTARSNEVKGTVTADSKAEVGFEVSDKVLQALGSSLSRCMCRPSAFTYGPVAWRIITSFASFYSAGAAA